MRENLRKNAVFRRAGGFCRFWRGRERLEKRPRRLRQSGDESAPPFPFLSPFRSVREPRGGGAEAMGDGGGRGETDAAGVCAGGGKDVADAGGLRLSRAWRDGR